MSGAPEPDPHEPQSCPAELARLAGQVEEIRGLLDALVRERRYRRFSPVRLAGGLVQVVAAGLLVLAALDWIFRGPGPVLYVELAFAAALQLVALTAFVVSAQRGD